MNVRQGDTAYVVWPGKVAHNHFVDVLKFIPPGTPMAIGGKQYRGVDAPAWWVRCSSPVRAKTGELVNEFAVRDANLRPIGTPDHGGVEETSFQKTLPTLAETITAALNTQKYGSQQ